MDLAEIGKISHQVKSQINRVVIGQDEAIDLMLVSLLTEGHILLEGPPGTAKTLLTQAFSKTVSLAFGRIQFTPDLMPGDVIGTNLFDFKTNAFNLSKGPIFTDILLADEINRTPPKTQSALLQAMGERTVTIDGKTYPLGDGFMVLATQNPIEQQGTYPLPEAQLDRFLFKHYLSYPSKEDELKIVALHGHRTTQPELRHDDFLPIIHRDDLASIRHFIHQIRLGPDIIEYIVDVIRETRTNSAVQHGASSRAANMLAAASCAYAVLNERDYVIPDDVKYLALPVLRHRLILSPTAEIEGLSSDEVVSQILNQVSVPR